MGHKEIRELLSDYIDGELDARQRRLVEEHSASCEECRSFLEDWKALSRAFFASPRKPAAEETESFVSRVMAALPEGADGPQDEPSSTFRLEWRWLFPALGLSFAALTLSFVPSRQEQDPSTTLLLAAGGSDRVSEWIAQSEAKGLEDLLVMEEQ